MAAIQVKGYQLIELTGRGASSEVYKARQLSSGSVVAVKVVRRGSADFDRHCRQISNEYRVAHGFTHPNLVRLYELVTARILLWPTQLALAMEYVEGEPLTGRKLTADEIVACYLQLADALSYMHGHGYIHLDMKPHNIMLTPVGEAKIVDFGLCTRKGRYNPRVQGTPDFMAPEQISKGWVDERTDIYNLGATVFHIITGRPVLMTRTTRQNGNGNGMHVVTSNTFQSLEVEIPDELQSLILQSCRHAPAERPASMKRVIEQLERIAGASRTKQLQR
jgi:serine/threonine-protein kinase